MQKVLKQFLRAVPFLMSFIFAYPACSEEKKEQEIVLAPHAQYSTPFEPQLSISKQEQECTVFVPQQFYAVMTPATKIQRAIVGPCCPCFMVAVRNEQQDTALVCHIPYSAQSFEKYLTAAVREYFALVEPKATFDWKVIIFSKSFAQASVGVKAETKWDEVKQEKCLEGLKKCLKKVLKSQSKTVSIQTMLSTQAVQGLSRAQHPEIDKSVALTRDLQVVSVSLLSQGLYELMPPTESEAASYDLFYSKTFNKYMELFGDKKSLARIPDNQAGLQQLQEHLKFVLKKQKHINFKRKDDGDGVAE